MDQGFERMVDQGFSRVTLDRQTVVDQLPGLNGKTVRIKEWHTSGYGILSLSSTDQGDLYRWLTKEFCTVRGRGYGGRFRPIDIKRIEGTTLYLDT